MSLDRRPGMAMQVRFGHALAALVSLATVLVYLPALRNDFVDWDDNIYVFEAAPIRTLDAAFFRWAFTTLDASNWHPLTWISYALDYAIWGLDPMGYHLTNIILHGVNTFVVTVLAMRLVQAADRKTSSGTDAEATERRVLVAAGATGALFGLHPLHVESVAWIAERKDLLCALFFLLSILSYLRFTGAAASGTVAGTVRPFSRNGHYVVSLLFCLLALMSKPMAVSLPFVLFILDWYPLGRITTLASLLGLFREKIPFLLLSAGSSLLTILAQKRVIADVYSVELSERMLVASQSLVRYLEYMLAPTALSPYYQYPYPKDISILFWEYAVPVMLVISLTAAAAFATRRQKLWFALWAYYGVTLLPVLGIVQVGAQSMADRYFYLPGIAPLLLVGLSTTALYERIRSATGSPRIAGISLAAAALLVLVPLSILTVRQIAVWRNTLVLWSTVKQYDPNVHLAYVYTGLTYLRQGRYEEAITELNTAIRLNAVHASAHNYLGVAYYKMGRLEEAIEKYRHACYLDSRYVQAHLNLGLAYYRRGDLDNAVAAYLTALSLDPDYAKAYYNLGLAYEDLGKTAEAAAAYQRALSLNPYFEEARDRLRRMSGT